MTLSQTKIKYYVLFLMILTIYQSCKESKISDDEFVVDGINTIYAGNMYYNPSNITITQGDSIQFINEEGFHDVYTTSGPVELKLNPCDGPCTIGILVFDVPGVYDYICSIGSHAAQGMVGTINVTSLE